MTNDIVHKEVSAGQAVRLPGSSSAIIELQVGWTVTRTSQFSAMLKTEKHLVNHQGVVLNDDIDALQVTGLKHISWCCSWFCGSI